MVFSTKLPKPNIGEDKGRTVDKKLKDFGEESTKKVIDLIEMAKKIRDEVEKKNESYR